MRQAVIALAVLVLTAPWVGAQSSEWIRPGHDYADELKITCDVAIDGTGGWTCLVGEESCTTTGGAATTELANGDSIRLLSAGEWYSYTVKDRVSDNEILRETTPFPGITDPLRAVSGSAMFEINVGVGELGANDVCQLRDGAGNLTSIWLGPTGGDLVVDDQLRSDSAEFGGGYGDGDGGCTFSDTGTAQLDGAITAPRIDAPANSELIFGGQATNIAGTLARLGEGGISHATGLVRGLEVRPTINTGNVAGDPAWIALDVNPWLGVSGQDPDGDSYSMVVRAAASLGGGTPRFWVRDDGETFATYFSDVKIGATDTQVYRRSFGGFNASCFDDGDSSGCDGFPVALALQALGYLYVGAGEYGTGTADDANYFYHNTTGDVTELYKGDDSRLADFRVYTVDATDEVRVGGSQIDSTDLSDTVNLARLNAANTFTAAQLVQNTLRHELYVEAHTEGVGSPYSVPTNETGAWYSNEGATARVYFSLPSAAVGLVYGFYANDADGLRVTAGAGDTIRLGTSVTGAGGYVEGELGSEMYLKAVNATEWVALFQGSWTADGDPVAMETPALVAPSDSPLDLGGHSMTTAGTMVEIATGSATHTTGEVVGAQVRPTINMGDQAGDPSWCAFEVDPWEGIAGDDPDATNYLLRLRDKSNLGGGPVRFYVEDDGKTFARYFDDINVGSLSNQAYERSFGGYSNAMCFDDGDTSGCDNFVIALQLQALGYLAIGPGEYGTGTADDMNYFFHNTTGDVTELYKGDDSRLADLRAYTVDATSQVKVGGDQIESADLSDSASLTRDTEWDTMAEINAASTDTDAVLDTDIGSTVQAYDADLDDLADGSLSESKLDAAVTRDTEWDTFAEINAASTDTDAVLDTDIGTTVQAYDADLDDLADGSLTGSKVAAATDTTQGAVELATSAEVDTGTDTTRAITPAGAAAVYSRRDHSRSLEWALAPTANGTIYWFGVTEETNTAASLTSASPVTAASPAYNARWAVDVSSAVGLPFTIRVTGTSISRTTGVTTGSDTEDIAVSANGSYMTTKWWVDASQVSIVEGSKSATVDITRHQYFDNNGGDFTVEGISAQWTPDSTAWSVTFQLIHVASDGSYSDIENVTFANTDSPPRAANGKIGFFFKAYAEAVNADTYEGINMVIDQTAIGSVTISVAYHDD